MTLTLIHKYCRIQRNGNVVYCSTNQNECIRGGHLDMDCFEENKNGEHTSEKKAKPLVCPMRDVVGCNGCNCFPPAATKPKKMKT